MVAFDVVRFKVKPAAFHDAHRHIAESWAGLHHAANIKTVIPLPLSVVLAAQPIPEGQKRPQVFSGDENSTVRTVEQPCA